MIKYVCVAMLLPLSCFADISMDKPDGVHPQGSVKPLQQKSIQWPLNLVEYSNALVKRIIFDHEKYNVHWILKPKKMGEEHFPFSEEEAEAEVAPSIEKFLKEMRVFLNAPETVFSFAPESNSLKFYFNCGSSITLPSRVIISGHGSEFELIMKR